MSAIHRYGQPVEVHPGRMPRDWELIGDQASWEDYVRFDAEDERARDLRRGVDNTEQFQRMSETFRYDPHYGVVPDFPF